jgi:hypothetical protein
MGRLLRFAALLATVVLVGPAAAQNGNLTLHPSGFGQHSYSAWKAKEGLADRTGNGNHSLYFQKMTATTTFAAGVAVFNNVFIRIEDFTGLEFWVGTDGHCGAGAPRFNIRLQERSTGTRNTVFVGCAEMVPGATAPAPNGRTFQQRTFTAPGPTACCGPLPTAGFDIVGLAIVYDEGQEFPPGFVHLDNILVESSAQTKCWTGPADNSANNTGPCPAPNTTLSPLSETLLFVDPAVQLAALAAAMPEVPVTSWVLYPDPQ